MAEFEAPARVTKYNGIQKNAKDVATIMGTFPSKPREPLRTASQSPSNRG
jgi:hypothetical protein